MLRSAVSKVMWVGRATVFLVGLAVILALLFGVVTTAAAHSNVDNKLFHLDHNNTVTTALTKLTGTLSGAVLKIDNDGAGTALDLKVGSGPAAGKTTPPMKVDSQAVVTNLNSDELDGKDQSAFASAYKRTVVVSPVGTDTQNGTALLNALASITDASAAKPYLLKIEPGVYDLGSSGSLEMKEHVDIEGSGELTTVITSSVTQGPGSDTACPIGTVAGANDTELRFLTVRNTGTGFCNIAIRNESVSPLLTHVAVESTGVQGADTGYFGVYNWIACPTISDATVTSSGFGVYSTGPSTGCSVLIKQSKISSVDHAVRQNPGISYVAHTQLVGTTSGVRCFNSYDENLQPHNCG
jgi:hypothetical protein